MLLDIGGFLLPTIESLTASLLFALFVVIYRFVSKRIKEEDLRRTKLVEIGERQSEIWNRIKRLENRIRRLERDKG